MQTPRLVFAGTPDFAVPCLEALIAAGYPVAGVYTQPDRPAGRGRKLQQSPVKQLALRHDLPVIQPASLKRDPDAVEALRALAPDLIVVVAYGLLLPSEVLRIPSLGCVNVHASLLPRWRGAAPIQRAILAGDAETGVCIMGMEEGLDTGPVYHRLAIPIDPRETGGSLHDKLAALGARALVEALAGIADGSLAPEPQSQTGVTYASKLSKEEAAIDWSQPALSIDRQIRAFDPWPVAHTSLGGETLRIWGAQAPDEIRDQPETGAAPGTVIRAERSDLLVATGDGVLAINRLQPPGKRAMSARDFLVSRKLDGERLG